MMLHKSAGKFVSGAAIAILLLLPAGATGAQATPVPTQLPTENCGLPATGNITASVIYNLSEDCTQTNALHIGNNAVRNDITVTVNGNGHRIIADGHRAFFLQGHSDSSITLNLNQVTLDGNRNTTKDSGSMIYVADYSTLNASNTTFTRSHLSGSVARFDHSSSAPASSVSGSFTKVLFEDNSASSSSRSRIVASALLVDKGISVTLNGAVFRSNASGPAVVTVLNGSTVTFSGCLSFSGNYPEHVYNSSSTVNGLTGRPACSGAIGNNGTAQLAAPAITACGMPATGPVDSSAIWTLGRTCNLMNHLIIAPGLTVRIKGNGHEIRSAGTLTILVSRRSTLELEDLTLRRVRIFNYGQVNTRRVTVTESDQRGLVNYGSMTLEDTLLENNSTSSRFLGSALMSSNSYCCGGSVTATNTIIRNSRGARGAISSASDMLTTLNGCLTLTNNLDRDDAGVDYHPDDFAAGRIIDNSAGVICDPALIGAPDPPPPDGGWQWGDDGTRYEPECPVIWPNLHDATPVAVYLCNGRWHIYAIISDRKGERILELSVPDNSGLTAAPVGQYYLRNPSSGKPVVVTWLPQTQQLEISTFYADDPPHQVNKPYVIRINRDHTVEIVAW